jgi:hypothetical protein
MAFSVAQLSQQLVMIYFIMIERRQRGEGEEYAGRTSERTHIEREDRHNVANIEADAQLTREIMILSLPSLLLYQRKMAILNIRKILPLALPLHIGSIQLS